MKITKNNQFGRSMVEMLGVLAIIGVLSIGAIAGYSKAMQKYKINKFTEQLSHIVTTIQIECSGRVSVSSMDLNYIIRKAIPDNMRDESGSFIPFWGERISIALASNVDYSLGRPITTSARDMFSVSMRYVPEDVCVAILTADWGTDLFGMEANWKGGSPSCDFYANQATGKSYTLEEAQEMCAPANSGSTGKKNVCMIFKF